MISIGTIALIKATVSLLTWDLETVSFKGEVFGVAKNPDDVIFLTPIDRNKKENNIKRSYYFRVHYFEEQH